MNARPQFRWWLIAILAGVGLGAGGNNFVLAQREPADPQNGVEVQTRGPVHEAFAGVVSFRPEPGIVVAKAPPDPIEEIPPDQKPAGANVAWITGYWAWDEDRDDFLWVSGIWRSLPPGRQWVPGYWTSSGEGYQWITGYWADAQASHIDYLPEPPNSLEEGASTAPPSPDHIWITGIWVWHDGRYAWRPGYWAIARSDWIWVPACYVWSPRGYVFVDGYWDYSVNRRGLLFAPVYIDAGLYGQGGFSYSPLFAINLAVFGNSLFLRPNYGHYYFGDYYDATYAGAGFYPWWSFNARFQNGYDPIFAAQRWQNRGNRGWEENLQAQFDKRRDNEDARPPRTLADQTKRGTSGEKSPDGVQVAAPLTQLASSKGNELHLQPVDQNQRKAFAQAGKKIRDFGGERQKLEAHAQGTPTDRASKAFEPTREKLPKSPIVATGGQHFEGNEAPPEPHKVPRPDPTSQHPTKKGGGGQSPAGDVGTKKGGPSSELPRPVAPKAEPKPKTVEPRHEPPNAAPPKPQPRVVPPAVGPPSGPPRAAPPKGEPIPKKVEPPKAAPPKPTPPKVSPPAVGPPRAAPPKATPPQPPPPRVASPPAKPTPGAGPKPQPPKPEPGEKPKKP